MALRPKYFCAKWRGVEKCSVGDLETDRAEEVRTAYLGRSQCGVGMSFLRCSRAKIMLVGHVDLPNPRGNLEA